MSISEVAALVWAVCTIYLALRNWRTFYLFFKDNGFDAYILVVALGGLVMSPLLLCLDAWRFLKRKYTIRRCK